jgi:hypothetical protein
MTYDELCTSIQDYVENTFSTTQIDVFIKEAEQRIYNSIQLPDLRKNVEGVITSGNKYLQCPDDFLSVYSIAVYDPLLEADAEYSYLLNKDVNFIREAYPNPNSTGTPKYYAIFGPQSANINELTFILGPTPNQDYAAELHYFYYPPSITSEESGGMTWLGDNFDSALLYGSILEAYTYLKGDADIMTNYRQRYEEAMNLLNTLATGKDRGDAYRNGQARIPVR